MSDFVTVLVDADALVYRVAAGCQEQYTLGNGVVASTASFNRGVEVLRQQVQRIRQDVLAEQPKLFPGPPLPLRFQYCWSQTTSEGEYWRHALQRGYKANRPIIRPLLLKSLADFLKNCTTSISYPSLEGDDVLGVHATLPDAGPVIVASPDKDMRQLPCLVYNFVKRSFHQPNTEPWRVHLLQALVGDSVDGYPGCPGIGPAKASKVLDKATTEAEAWAGVVALFEKAKLTEADALIQARLSRILTASEYNIATGKIKLWTPPQSR
jgi:5'-3' exonuclease